MIWFRRESGAGPSLVLLHGWGMESRAFDAWMPWLDPYFHCIRPDLPGHGNTPCGSGLAGPPVREALEALAGEYGPPILVAWSMGSLFALDFALRYPDRLRGLVLLAGSPHFCQSEGWTAGIPDATLEAFARELQEDPAGTRRRFLALQVLHDPGGRRALGDAGRWPLPEPSCLQDGLSLLRGLDLRPQLRPLSLPAILVHGRQDRIVPLAAASYLHGQLPGSRLEILDAGHAPFLTHPGTCARLLRESFLP